MDQEARKRRADARRQARRAKKRRAGRAVSQNISDSEASSESEAAASDAGSDRRKSPEHHGDTTVDSDGEMRHEDDHHHPSPMGEEDSEHEVSPQPSENLYENNSDEETTDAENQADVAVVSAEEESRTSTTESESDAESEGDRAWVEVENVPDTKMHAAKDASVHGIKGPTLLAKIVPDIIKGTGIDIMHGVFLGVFKMVLNLWLSPSFSGMPWSVSHLSAVLDEKLCKIKSPNFADRAPRTLKEIKFWKASEYKQFMLYYSVPLLKNVLEEAYLKHHCTLVAAISLLSQDSISLDQIQTASALLASYVSQFACLYPLRYLGLNVHQLLHLGDVTLEIGPSWVCSCFFLESFNGVINKMFHGTQHIALQICSTVSMMMKIPEFKSMLPPDSKVKEYCLRLEQGFKQLKIADVIDASTNAVRKYSYDRAALNHSAQVVSHTLRKVGGTCCVFFRLQKRGVIYFAEEYPHQSLRKESSFITFQENGSIKIGRIVRFVRWSNCGYLCDIECRNCPADYVAIVRVLERKHWFIHDMRDIRISHIFHVQQTENIAVVHVQSILSSCFYFEADTLQYVAVPVNRLERE